MNASVGYVFSGDLEPSHRKPRMFEKFSWRGEPITDIRDWAAERGERMVPYRGTRATPWGDEVIEGEMPQTFWDCLLMRDGWHYTEIKE